MLNLFKSKRKYLETAVGSETFKLGNYIFSVDHSQSVVEIGDHEIIDLTIKTSEEEFDSFLASESFEFSWALYSPMFYARGIKFNQKKHLIINDKNRSEHEVGLYFMEHCDATVNISLKDDCILITGFANLFGKKYPLEIFVNY